MAAPVYPVPAVLQNVQTAVVQLAEAIEALNASGGALTSVQQLSGGVSTLQAILTTWYTTGLF